MYVYDHIGSDDSLHDVQFSVRRYQWSVGEPGKGWGWAGRAGGWTSARAVPSLLGTDRHGGR